MSPTTQCWAPPLLQFLSLGLSVPAWSMPVFLSSLLPGQSHSVTFPTGPDGGQDQCNADKRQFK